MAIVQDICILALRPLIGDAAEPAVRLICDHLTDHSQRLPLALQTANDRAWMALELALVEESWWQKIWSNRRAADERALAKQVQAFLENQPLSELRGQPGDYRQECWRELRLAREKRLICGTTLSSSALVSAMAGFRRFAAPDQLLREDLDVLGRMAGQFDSEGFSRLSWLLKLQVSRGNSLLVTAVRFFFRREVEENRQLFQGLAFAQLEALGRSQEEGLDALRIVVTQHSDWMNKLLSGIDEKLDDLHDKTDELNRKLDEQDAKIEELLRILRSGRQQKPETPPEPPGSSGPASREREPAPTAPVQAENWISCGRVELALNVAFDRTAYPVDDDPNVRLLWELAVRRSQSAPESAVTADIVLVLDVSRSMNRPDRYPLLCKAVEQFLGRLKPTDQVGIVLFSTAADRVMKLHPGKAKPATSRILARMDQSSIRFGQHTCLAPALRDALDLFDSTSGKSVRRLYVLTDGELHDAAACAESLAGTLSRRIEVHVYGFGDGFDSAALKLMVKGQLGGSVKPICKEEDIVGTFAHVAEANSRLVVRDARLSIEFNQQVVCGDAWTFRPQARHLGRVRNRRLEHDLGGLEEGRTYSLLFEGQLPPDRSVFTPVAYARVTWQDDHGEGQHWQIIGVPRVLAGDARGTEAVPRVVQTFAMLDVLRRPQDQQAEIAAAEAQLQLALVEKREDPRLLAALTGHLAALKGLSDSADDLAKRVLGRLDAAQMHFSIRSREAAQYVAADQRTVNPGDRQSDPVARLHQLQAQLMLVREAVLPGATLAQVEDQVEAIRAQIAQQG